MTQPLSLSGILPTRNPWRGWSAATQDDPNADRQGWQSLDVPKDMPFSLSGSQQPEQPKDSPPPYATSTFPERNVAALDGLSMPFLTGQPAPQQPAFNDALGAASAQEDERFRNRVSGEKPYQEEIPVLFGQGLGVNQTITPPAFDYKNALLNSGTNIDRDSFVNSYDAQQRAQNAQPLRSELGEEMPLDTSATAFRQPTPGELASRARNAQEFGSNLIAGATPVIGQALAAKNAYDSGSAAADDFKSGRNAWPNLGGMALSLSGVVPGMGSGARYAEEAAAANLSKRLPILDNEGNQAYRPLMPWENGLETEGARVRMNPDGTPVTRMASTADPMNPSTYPRESPMWEAPATRTPSASLNSLVGYPPDYVQRVKTKITNAINEHIQESARIEATMQGPEREAALRAADAKFNEAAYVTRDRQPMQGPPVPKAASPPMAPAPEPTPQDNPFPRGRPPKRRLTPDGPVEAPGATRGMTALESAAFRRRYWRNQDSNNSTSE